MGEGDLVQLREGVRTLCERFSASYWRELEARNGYPKDFVEALSQGGYLTALIPTEYGGSGSSLLEASVILEEIHHSGGNAAAWHGQMYTMGILLRHGSTEQKRRYLPAIASGSLWLQSFAVTEPTAGSDTASLSTTATRDGSAYVAAGQKLWTSRVQHSDLMIVLARSTPVDQVRSRTDALLVFLIDLREAIGNGMTLRRLRTMLNHETNEVFFDGLRLPETALIGEEGGGYRYILDGLNAERILIASECVGDGYWFIDHASAYACQRVVFDRHTGANQGVAFPPTGPRLRERQSRRPHAGSGGTALRPGAGLRCRGQHG